MAPTDRDWSFVVTAANHGPGHLSDARVIETPPLPVLSVRPSQGRCVVATNVTCDLGPLAAGSAAFVTVTVRASGERDFVSTAIVSARAEDGTRREASALTSTRAVRHAAALTLRRPTAETAFRVGRNNTIQWTLRGVAGGVSIDLSRDDGESWTRLIDEAENVGFYDWTGEGEETVRARIRVTSVAKPELTQTSPVFPILSRRF